MSDDKSDKLVRVFALEAIKMVPFGALAIAIAKEYIPNTDEQFQEGVKQELLQTQLDLNKRVAQLEGKIAEQGHQLESLGLLRTTKIFEDFFRAYVATKGNEKREGLHNAAAHQFDPTIGSLAFRQRWFRAVAALDDSEAAVVRLFRSDTNGLFFNERTWTISRGPIAAMEQAGRTYGGPGKIEPLSLARDEVTGIVQVLTDLVHARYVSTFAGPVPEGSPASRAEWSTLTPAGAALLRVMEL